MGSSNMQKSTVFALFMLAAAVWAVTEVQELGNDDTTSGVATSLDADDSAEYDEIGENLGVGVGRRAGGFLSTSGSFTLSSGGGGTGDGNNEEDELGEGIGVGRRAGGFLSTQGSFTLSSGGGGTGDGNNEEDYFF